MPVLKQLADHIVAYWEDQVLHHGLDEQLLKDLHLLSAIVKAQDSLLEAAWTYAFEPEGHPAAPAGESGGG